MSSVPPVYCPECRSEYLGTASVCVDCDVSLVGEAELDEYAKTLPATSELVCIRAASVSWAQGLSERLAAEGISHRIEAASDDDDGSVRRPVAKRPDGVYVRSEDVEVASRVDAVFIRSQIPDLPVEAEVFGGAAGPEVCPACGAEIGSGVSECSACGLALSVGE